MKNIWSAAVLALLFPLLGIAQKTLPDSVVTQLKQAVEGFKNRYHSPSLVLVIVHDQEVIFDDAVGYMDLEEKLPATSSSRYPILSVTKTFTATMLMQLSERKLVTIHDDVRKYVPEFQSALSPTERQKTTLFQLATHTSGLPRNSPADIDFSKQVDRWILARRKYDSIRLSSVPEFLKSLTTLPVQYPKFQFLRYGDRHYSNLGYSLLGIALERATKRSYATYIMENICRPLNMSNTGFIHESNTKNPVAKGYAYDDSLKIFVPTPQFVANSGVHAGGMLSTGLDLARFISFQFDNRTEANSILSADNKAMMRSFNIGWKPSFPLVLHEGAMLGYRCEIAFHPDYKIGWVILTNTTSFEFSRFNEYILSKLIPVFGTTVGIPADKLIGTYRLSGGYDSLKIYMKEGNLHSTYLENELTENRLFSAGENRFKSAARGNYNIGYEFISNEGKGEILLNMGQLMWIKQN